ncbi:MAG: hypothetical protein ACOCX4_08500 [Planctomycetota bacterium]
MAFLSPYFEALMLICFGAAWPAAIVKTLRVKRVEGMSIYFFWLIFSGYGSGILYKFTGNLDWVVALHTANFCMVGVEIILYYHYRRWPGGRGAVAPQQLDPAGPEDGSHPSPDGESSSVG